MSVITWNHNTTKFTAFEAVKNEIQKLGYENKVKWEGDEVTASVAWRTILDALGASLTIK